MGRTLVYAPSVMTSELPWDVHAFKQLDKVFPHHSTVDQLFTDQKFEAYRVLGRQSAVAAMTAMDAAPRQPEPRDDGGSHQELAAEVLETVASNVAALLRSGRH